jgi:hypothetical protein
MCHAVPFAVFLLVAIGVLTCVRFARSANPNAHLIASLLEGIGDGDDVAVCVDKDASVRIKSASFQS